MREGERAPVAAKERPRVRAEGQQELCSKLITCKQPVAVAGQPVAFTCRSVLKDKW